MELISNSHMHNVKFACGNIVIVWMLAYCRPSQQRGCQRIMLQNMIEINIHLLDFVLCHSAILQNHSFKHLQISLAGETYLNRIDIYKILILLYQFIQFLIS